ncbi:MAG: chromosome segregation SMC family protein [Candidatus Micrarchaeaceae archaeon]
MIYLKELTLHKFKSFQHAELTFSKGFTCIVGPNGSGKSNICDAILFSLGESALHRLRVERLESLINESANRKKTPKAYVRALFDGDERLEVVRVIRADGKSIFRASGKRLSMHDVIEILKRYKIDANETNTITQGEINRIIEMSPKERRGLIEIASGISEFEEKKKEALGELDKVNVKIGEAQIMLNERLGFLKEIEKEKEAAEKYTELRKRIRSLNYSILSIRKEVLSKDYDSYVREISALEEEASKLRKSIDDSNAVINALSEKAQQTTKDLNRATGSAGESSRRLSELRVQLATIDAEINSLSGSIRDAELMVEESKKKIAETNEKIILNTRLMGELDTQIDEKSKSLETMALDTGEDGRISRLAEIGKEIRDLEEKLTALQKAYANAVAASDSYKARAVEIEKQISAKEKEISDAKMSIGALRLEIDALGSEIEKTKKEIAALESDLGAGKEISEIESKILELREQRAIAYSRSGGIDDKLGQKFGPKNGFYGRAAQLCTYEDAYANAVEAAAGGKFDYLVVDSIETASSIIDYMKTNRLGRATFIPISEISTAAQVDDAEHKKVIDLVKFDERFKKVFEYIFGNTYLVDSLDEAKRSGIGRRRYVTIDGELVEQSGIVSGGYMKRQVRPLAYIEKQLADLEARHKELAKIANDATASIFAKKKELALKELTYKSRLDDAEKLNVAIRNAADALKSLKSARDAAIAGSDSASSDAQVCSKDLESTLERIKHLQSIENEIYGSAPKSVKARIDGAEASMKNVESLRREIEDLKIRRAGVEKENQLLAEKNAEISESLRSKLNEIKAAKDMLDAKSLSREKIAKLAESLEEEIKASSESNKKAYAELEQINAEIANLSSNKGMLSAKLERAESSLNDLKLKKSQVETRLNDISAELSTYSGDDVELIAGDAEELSKQLAIATAKLNELGSVNMKAPEIYNEKKALVDEVYAKLETLESERQAIMRMIDEVDSKKLNVFTEALNNISANFSKLYSYMLPGSAEIELDNPESPFESNLSIKIRNNGISKRVESLSGGEKTLILITLVFAIHMYKPSSLYIFDEIDAALDKENSKKLSKLLRELSKNAQFIVVSHNDSLISEAETVIGVAMSNNTSRVFGVEVSSLINKAKGQADGKR